MGRIEGERQGEWGGGGCWGKSGDNCAGTTIKINK